MYKAAFNPDPEYSTLLPRAITALVERFRNLLASGESTAPFQFTLPFMAALYHDMLLDEVSKDFLVPIAKKYPQQGVSNRSLGEQLPLEKNKPTNSGPKWPYGEPDYTEALDAPLRAIAFFSWENESRLFLARRVYPTFFDFLSYSHCPAEWGALGSLLAKLEKNTDFPTKEVFHQVSKFRQRALPFLEEVDRLGHQAIWCLPIMRERGLQGALLFFLRESRFQPDTAIDKTKHNLFRYYLQDQVCKPLSELLELQQQLLDKKKVKRLHVLWREEVKKKTKDTRILEVIIMTQQGKDVLFQGCAKVVSRLSSYSLRAVIDEANSRPDKKAVLLVAASDPDIDIKPDVLRLIGEVFDFYKKPVTVHFKWLPSPPPRVSHDYSSISGGSSGTA